jgi:hypothetical protein
MEAPTYIHLVPGEALPALENVGPFRAVVVIEDEVTPEWRSAVSSWLDRSGCRYAMTWGLECEEWHDSIDDANLSRFDFAEVPEDEFVMTTWHERDMLKEVFWFSIHCAMHPSLELGRTIIVHIAPRERSAELLQAFREVQDA